MHDDTTPFDSQSQQQPRVPDALADEFFTAVERLRSMVDGKRELVVEAEAFAEAAKGIVGDLRRLRDLNGHARAELQFALVHILDGVTSVALECEPPECELHRAAFEVAVTASRLAAFLRGSSITWH